MMQSKRLRRSLSLNPFSTSTYFHTPKKTHSSDFAASFLPAFRASNPHMEVLEEVRAGHHPSLRGEYREFLSLELFFLFLFFFEPLFIFIVLF